LLAHHEIQSQSCQLAEPEKSSLLCFLEISPWRVLAIDTEILKLGFEI